MNWHEFLRDKRRLFKTNYSRAPLYAKVVTHRITPYLVFFCMKLGLTPDQVTVVSMLVGWASAILFAFPSSVAVLVAALGFELYYVLDSVDGQLARITGKCSKTGAFFDILLNYLVHPLPFIFIGLNQTFVTGNWIWTVGGSLAGLSYIWLGLMWNVRAHVLFDSLREPGPAAVSLENLEEEQEIEREKRFSLMRRAFSSIHKLCTFPTAMNLITVTAVLEFLTGNLSLFRYLVGFYSLALPAVSLFKIGKMVVSREVDKEYERRR